MIDGQNMVISVVCYNNEVEVVTFAKAVAMQSLKDNIFLIVTCNSVKDYDYLEGELNRIDLRTFLHKPGKNLGYLNGCLYGVSKTILPKTYWLTVCNTDLTFESESFFEDITRGVEKDTWCIGPNIVLKTTEKKQNPFFKLRPSYKAMQMRRFVYSYFLTYKLYCKLSEIKEKTVETSRECNSQYVYSVHGSCFILKSDIVSLLTKEAKNIFMYGEELLVAEIIRENEKKVYFNSCTTVIHDENQVTRKITTKTKQEWFVKSTNYLCRRFFEI